jgi:type IV secretion system protein VirB5
MNHATATALLTLILLSFGQNAHAQFAVIDASAIAQLVQQVEQLKQGYQSVTGTRGMQTVLSGINRNYFPSTYLRVPAALAAPIRSTLTAHAVLTSTQLSALSPAEQQQIIQARNNAALLEVTTEEAYATTSGRFAAVQQLINTIGTTTDEKGILELQGRIQGELAMLTNDNTKLQLLYQATQAQEQSRRQVALEQAVASTGNLRTLAALRLP